MPRYFLHLCYDGANYSGWQVQDNAPSVQQTINEAAQKLLGYPVSSMGCGRTDAGVHAKDFYMHFDAQQEIADRDDFLFRMNCIIPNDIFIYRLLPVHEKAHTRFDATERTYEYFVHFDKSPFIKKYSFYQGYYEVDWEKVLAVTDFLKSIEDFTSLCLPSEDFKTNICLIKEAKWEILPSHHLILKPFDERAENIRALTIPYQRREGQVLRLTITSNRFLRGMIRKIVGTTLMVGKRKIEVDEFKETVAAKKEFRVHYLAPANGLFLAKIRYPYI